MYKILRFGILKEFQYVEFSGMEFSIQLLSVLLVLPTLARLGSRLTHHYQNHHPNYHHLAHHNHQAWGQGSFSSHHDNDDQVSEEKQQQAMAMVIMGTVGLEKEKYRLGHTKVILYLQLGKTKN